MRGMQWCCLCVVTLLLATSQALSINVDCSLPENAPKCKARAGTPVLKGAAQYASQAKELVKLVDQFLGGNGMASRFAAGIESSLAEQSFVDGMMSQQEKEIQFVKTDLLRTSEAFVARCFALAKTMRANATDFVKRPAQSSETARQSEYIAGQQKLIDAIEKLQKIRNDVEQGYLGSDASPTGSLIQQSHLLQLKLEHALRRTRESSEQEDAIAMLETATGLSASEKAVRLLDELLEEFRQLRTLMRDEMDKGRDHEEQDMESIQSTVDFLLSSVHILHADAIATLRHVHKLRVYLRQLTASQYRTFEWGQLIRKRVKSAAEMIDAAGHLVSDSQPLFDEMLHYLTEGDTPFNRTTVSALDCSGRTDVCGVCGGTGNTCSGCDGVALSGNVFDVCGQCVPSALAASGCSNFCDGVVNSGKVNDMCGVCGGDDSSCMGCDNIINSGVTFDRCGICGGDGMSCDKATECRNVDCPAVTVTCLLGTRVSSDGFQGCCFNPATDCLPNFARA